MTTSQSILSLLIGLLLIAGCTQIGEVRDQPDGEAANQEVQLFDGTTLDGWAMAGPGGFELEDDGSMRSEGGMGLLYYEEQSFRDYELELDWKASSAEANSGVFLRFPEATDDPWDAVGGGYEIQILDDAQPIHKTGSIYDFSAPFKLASNPPGEWNNLRVKVTGQRYQVYVNNEKVNDFFGDRGREGYIGLQNHDPESVVWFRDIRVQPLPDDDYPETLASHIETGTSDAPIRILTVTASNVFFEDPARAASMDVLESLDTTTDFDVEFAGDLRALNRDGLQNYDVLFLNNAALRAYDQAGVWQALEVSVHSNDEIYEGYLTLYGEEDDLAGYLQLDRSRLSGPLDDVSVEDSLVTFDVTLPDGSELEGELVMEEPSIQGSITLNDETRTQLTGTALPAEFIASEMDAVTLTSDQQDALIDFVQSGKGFVGASSALSSFPEWDAYRELVGGGLSEGVLWNGSFRGMIEKRENPAVTHEGDGFWLRDQLIELDENPRWNARVLSSVDMRSVGVAQGSPDQTRDDHPLTWMRNQGEGRVFMTALGQTADVWETPTFVEHLAQGLRMASGQLEADFSGHRVREVLADDVWPHDIALDEYNNVWIAELRGKIHLYDSAENTTRLVGELATTDPTNIEHGLFGIEVDPEFHNGEPYIYLFYTEQVTFINTLSRFEFRDGELDLENEEVLLRVPTEPYCCHQAGDIEWGPDGTLYLSTGDTGMSETRPTWELTDESIEDFLELHNLEDYHWTRLADSEATSQNLQELRGKVLRINKDGSIPHDNPFFGEPGVRWEIFAYGMRNPFQFTVDPQTGKLYIGVVGPDGMHDFAEYNVSTGGENFGWPRSIGRLFYNELTIDDIPNFQPPMWEYTYETGGRSPFNGPVYRHDGEGGFPEIFHDKIFILDWARNWIKWADVSDETFVEDTTRSHKRNHTPLELPATRYVDIRTFDTTSDTSPMTLELGSDGALYFAEFDGFWDAGPNSRLTRYRWVRGLQPVSSASIKSVSDDELTFHFDGSQSYDPDAGALSYEWSFGDGTEGTGARPVHTYQTPGSYQVTLTVTDSEGLTSDPYEIEVVAGSEAYTAVEID